MTDAACPYCRAPLGEDPASLTICPVCGTPHHADCFEENVGCTVFGCSAAPAAEPKVSIGAGELHNPPPPSAPVFDRVAPPPALSRPAPPPPPGSPAANPPVVEAPLFSSLGYGVPIPVAAPAMVPARAIDPLRLDGETSAKSRTAFLVLGAMLGWAGVHSFYAGSVKKGFLQLSITVFTLGIAGLMVWIWAIIDICTITTDSQGLPFRM